MYCLEEGLPRGLVVGEVALRKRRQDGSSDVTGVVHIARLPEVVVGLPQSRCSQCAEWL